MLYLTLVFILAKNLIYYTLLRNKIHKVLFTILGYIVMVGSIPLARLLINLYNEHTAIIAVIANIDFFILFFSFVLILYKKVLDIFAKRIEVANPIRFFFDIEINLKYFYITITIIQVLLITILWNKLS